MCQLSIYNSFAVIRTIIAKKSSFLRTPAFIFCLPWGRRCSTHAKRCMNEKTIQCLPNSSQHVPIYLEQFSSYSNRKCKKSPFLRTAAHIVSRRSPDLTPSALWRFTPPCLARGLRPLHRPSLCAVDILRYFRP